MGKSNNIKENQEIRDEINLINVLMIFKNDWKIITCLTGIFIIFGIIYAIFAIPWFKAEVKIMPTIGEGNQILGKYTSIAAIAGINIGGESSNNYYLYPEIIKSNFILDKILEHKFKNKLYNKKVSVIKYLDIDVDTTKENWKYMLWEKAKKRLRKEFIHPFLNDENDLLTIQVTVPKDPILAEELANFILEKLDDYNKNFRHYKARDQRKFIEESLIKNRNDLTKAENALKDFLYKNKNLKAPEPKLEYEKLYNELQLQRTLYNELKKQLELAKIEEVKETETINILDKAVVPIERYKPKRTFIVIITFILGIIFSLTIVILKNYYTYLKNNF